MIFVNVSTANGLNLWVHSKIWVGV